MTKDDDDPHGVIAEADAEDDVDLLDHLRQPSDVVTWLLAAFAVSSLAIVLSLVLIQS